MTFPISRQGLEQLALLLLIGAVAFAVLAALARRRGRPWRRGAVSAGALGALAALALALGYTLAPNIPTPPVPLTARFQANPTPDTPETVAIGRRVYQANCVVCHGPQGRGDGPAAFAMNPKPFDLTVHVPQHAPGEVHYWISEGVPGTQMPAWKGQLSETERWALVRYLQALAKGES